MKRTNYIARTISLLTVLLWTTVSGNTSLLQTQPLKHGKMVLNESIYDVRIRDGHDDVYIDDDSLYDKQRALISPDATFIPEGFIRINTDRLLGIKRRFYPSSLSRIRVTAVVTKDGKLIGMEYTLPKSPLITEDGFRTLDAQIRRYLNISIVFPNEQLENQKYHGYTKKTVILY